MTDLMNYWQLKMRRADQHLQSLESEMGRLVQSCYDGMISQQKRDRDVVQFRRVLSGAARPSSELLGATVGDFVQNLRSSLDHLIAVLTWDYSDQLLDGTEFPIFWEQAKYDRRHNAGGPHHIRGIDPAAQAIVESLQPYHRGDDARTHPLWLLHDLANLDKHRITPWFWMHATNSAPAISGVTDMEIASLETTWTEGPVNTGTQFSLISARIIGENPSMQMQDNVEFEVRFEHGTCVAGQPVVRVCRTLRDFVRDEVFPLFEPFHRSPLLVVTLPPSRVPDLGEDDLSWRSEDLE